MAWSDVWARLSGRRLRAVEARLERAEAALSEVSACLGGLARAASRSVESPLPDRERFPRVPVGGTDYARGLCDVVESVSGVVDDYWRASRGG